MHIVCLYCTCLLEINFSSSSSRVGRVSGNNKFFLGLSSQSRSTNMVPFWARCDFSLSMWPAPRTRVTAEAAVAGAIGLVLLGWTCSEPLRRGLAGRHCSTGRAHFALRGSLHQLHFLGREHNLGLKSFNQYPSPRPLTPQRGETCRSTLPTGTLAEGRHTHTQHTPW